MPESGHSDGRASTEREGPGRAEPASTPRLTAPDPSRGSSLALNKDTNTAYIFDTLELRRAGYNLSNSNEYEVTEYTEVPYLFANGVRLARIVYQPTIPQSSPDAQHVFFLMGDHLGSTTNVVDKKTGGLVEHGTYMAYGAAESDYRPDEWGAFREDYRFTGKEEDVQVGLVYFGKRFLSPYLNRWVSPDPLEVHDAGQADLNLYAYVSGMALKATDPLGLDPADTRIIEAAAKDAGVPVPAKPMTDTATSRESLLRAVVPEAAPAKSGDVEAKRAIAKELGTAGSAGPILDPGGRLSKYSEPVPQDEMPVFEPTYLELDLGYSASLGAGAHYDAVIRTYPTVDSTGSHPAGGEYYIGHGGTVSFPAMVGGGGGLSLTLGQGTPSQQTGSVRIGVGVLGFAFGFDQKTHDIKSFTLDLPGLAAGRSLGISMDGPLDMHWQKLDVAQQPSGVQEKDAKEAPPK